MIAILKKPTAWIPIALSLAVLAAMLIGIATYGVPTRQPDEGTAAHMFQIWLVLEASIMAVFAIKWLPQSPKQVSFVLAIQIVAALAACAPVFFLKL